MGHNLNEMGGLIVPKFSPTFENNLENLDIFLLILFHHSKLENTFKSSN